MSALFADTDLETHTIAPDPMLKLQLQMEEMMDNIPLSEHLPLLRVQTRLVRVSATQGCDVYIGAHRRIGGVEWKPTKWCNPFQSRGNFGLAGVAALRYRRHLQDERPDLLAALHELRGKVLGCTCERWMDAPCHGEVLVELVNQLR